MLSIHRDFKLNGKSYSKRELQLWAIERIGVSKDFIKETAAFLIHWLDETDAVVVQTSGTTGVPKEMEIAKEVMIASAKATGTFFELQPGSTALCCLPVKYIAGKMMLVRAMVLGWEIDLVEPSSQPLLHLNKKYDFVAMVPMQVKASLSDLHKVKTLLIGGAAVDSELSLKLIQLRCNAFESYSMTETVTHIALKKIGKSYFKALPGVSLSVDVRGCLIIDAPNLKVQHLITNDIVDLLCSDRFVWKGRVDNVVNSGGIKLFPEQIENKLTDLIPSRFFCMGMPDEKLGECLVLIIEGESYEINESIFEQFEKYEKPKYIYFIDKFDETETGKIKRNVIKDYLKRKAVD